MKRCCNNINEMHNSLMLFTTHINNDIQTLYENIAPNNKIHLFEEYGYYDGIMDDIDNISTHVLDMLKTNKTEYVFAFSSKSMSKLNKCHIKFENVFYGANASCEIHDNNLLDIHIKIANSLRFSDEKDIKEWIEDSLETCLIHELTHGKNDYEFYSKYNKITDNPEWYNIAYENMFKYNSNSIERNFLYALYISYYGEVQAISNETISRIMLKINKDKNFNTLDDSEKKNIIINLLSNDNSYTDFITIKNVLLPILKKALWFQKENIYKIFKDNGIDMNDALYKKYLKQIEFACDRAISKMKRGLNIIFKKYNLI